METETETETETGIYFQTLLIYRDLKPIGEVRSKPSVTEVSGRWYLIKDSDLHRHRAGGKNALQFHVKEGGVCSKGTRSCGIHKAYDDPVIFRGLERQPLPCGDVLDWVSKSTPPNVMGVGALLAVPTSPSSSSAITIYMIGGVDRAALHGLQPPTGPNTTSSGSYVTEEVFYKENVIPGLEDEGEKELGGGGGWKKAPPLNKARSLAHPVLYKRKIYVFGGVDRRTESPHTMDWSPWAEVLDLDETGHDNWAWKGLANPPKDLGDHLWISAHCILDDDNKFLLYSPHTGVILSYDPVKDSYVPWATEVGELNGAAAFLDGFLYGVCFSPSRDDKFMVNTLYYFDLKDQTGPAKPLIDFYELEAGHVIDNGLIPVGRDLLYVVTSDIMILRRAPSRGLSRVYVLKFRISKTITIGKSIELQATLESKASYFFKDVTCVESCLGPLAVRLESMRCTYEKEVCCCLIFPKPKVVHYYKSHYAHALGFTSDGHNLSSGCFWFLSVQSKYSTSYLAPLFTS